MYRLFHTAIWTVVTLSILLITIPFLWVNYVGCKKTTPNNIKKKHILLLCKLNLIFYNFIFLNEFNPIKKL